MSLTTDGMFTGALLSVRVSQRATAREVARRTLVSLLLLLLAVAGARGARSLPQHLRSDPARDMAVLAKQSGGYTVFVADSRSRTIRYHDVKAEKDIEVWDLQDFEPFLFKGGRVPQHPTALAVNATTLFVVDREEEGVFAVDLETRVSQLLLQRPLIYKPLSVAVSEAGIIAIGQDNEGVTLYNPATPDVPPRPMPGEKIDDPVRLQFTPSDSEKTPSLFVLDSEDEGTLTLYEPSGRDSYTPRQIQIPGGVAARLEVREDTTLDSAFADGNFYLTEGRNWAVFSRVGLTSARWVLFPAMYRVTPDRIREAGGALFVLDAEHGKVLRLLLKQMTVRIEVTAPEANVMLGELYQALYDERNGSLPEREYVVHSSEGKKTLEEILKAQHVLVPGTYSPTFAPAENATTTPADRFEYLMCLLNKKLNNWKCPDTLSSPVNENDRRLQRRFGERQALVIPGMGVERTPYEGSVQLAAGKSLKETVMRRLMVEQPLAAITTEYLMRKDPAYYRTIDYEMTRRGYILPSSFLSPPELTPGLLLRIVQNREQAASAQDCQPAWVEVAGQKQTEPVPELTEKLRSYTPSLEYLPRKETTTSDASVLAEWGRMGVVALEMVFDGPVEELGSRRALAAQSSAPDCWGALAGKDTYVVGDVIRVAGARFRLLKKDGETVQPKSGDLARWGIDGEMDESTDWSFRVPKSYVLAYRALPWDGQPLASEKQLSKRSTNIGEPDLRFVTDPHAIKPGSVQDIWAKTSGKFVLPGFRWDIKLLTDSTTLAEGSVIRKWAAKYPDKVYVWPAGGQPSGDTKPDTIAEGYSAAAPQEDLARVASNREQLRKSIAFPADVKSGDIIIGLMERSGSVNRLNQDFAWKQIKEECDSEDLCPWEFVWLEAPEDRTSPPQRLRHTVSQVTRAVRTSEQIGPQPEEYWKNNHGTHVAGLLASNYQGALGLVPDAKICWLELGNPPVPLPDQITQQNSNSLRVINVSQEFLDDSYDWLKNQLDTEGADLKPKLFVIAAGNDGCDLNRKCKDGASGTDIEVRPPVAWLHQFNNLLSVSATDMEHKLLLKDDGGYRVNYGVRYVDLLAPGYEIYSSTEGSAYAATTGTSQAAPPVTATAAVLAKVNGGAVDPSLLKGRLIYTADWEGSTLEEREKWDPKHGYFERVWGGSLNAGRAILHYDRDIFLYDYGPTSRNRAIHDIPDQLDIVIKNWKTGGAFFVRQPRGDSEQIKAALSEADSRIKFGQVLRMTRLKGGLYRIMYKSKTYPWELRIIMNASIEPGQPIRYRSYEEVLGDKLGEAQFSQKGETLRLDSIIDYVGSFNKMGQKIAFY